MSAVRMICKFLFGIFIMWPLAAANHGWRTNDGLLLIAGVSSLLAVPIVCFLFYAMFKGV